MSFALWKRLSFNWQTLLNTQNEKLDNVCELLYLLATTDFWETKYFSHEK